MDTHRYYVTAPLVQLKKLAGILVETMTEFRYNAGSTIEIQTVQDLPQKVLREFDLMKVVCGKLNRRFNLEHYVTEE